jgi:hypothetical protein
MLIPYTILEECLVLGSNLVCSGAVVIVVCKYLIMLRHTFVHCVSPVSVIGHLAVNVKNCMLIISIIIIIIIVVVVVVVVLQKCLYFCTFIILLTP